MAIVQTSNINLAYILNSNRDKKPEDEKDKYSNFIKLLASFLMGSRDQTNQSTYEDDCRAMFGVQSYVLFTLDKLISQLTKHVFEFLFTYS